MLRRTLVQENIDWAFSEIINVGVNEKYANIIRKLL
jgi:hypothetical protein